jgi:CHAD domain-containing protein
LRVTLRRLRTALRVFKPVIRRTVNRRLAWVARYIGAIVGELRDADVIVDEMLHPTAEGERLAALSAVEAWREELRLKVRASLKAARATAFTHDLVLLAQNGGWRRTKSRRSEARRAYAASALIDETLTVLQSRAAALGSRMLLLTPAERHDLRKDIKTMRYAAELSAGCRPEAAELALSLKRLQTVLGQLNDTITLQTFEPAIGREQEAFAKWRERLIEERDQLTPGLVANAAARWRALAATGRFSAAAALCA